MHDDLWIYTRYYALLHYSYIKVSSENKQLKSFFFKKTYLIHVKELTDIDVD